jgi:hypothetical protein
MQWLSDLSLSLVVGCPGSVWVSFCWDSMILLVKQFHTRKWYWPYQWRNP